MAAVRRKVRRAQLRLCGQHPRCEAVNGRSEAVHDTVAQALECRRACGSKRHACTADEHYIAGISGREQEAG